MPVATYNVAQEVQQIDEDLIQKYHPHLIEGKEFFAYLYREGGQVAWNVEVKKCNPLMNYLMEGKVLYITAVRGNWERMSIQQKYAEIDHALCHINRVSAGKIQNDKGEVVETWEDAEEPDSWNLRDHEVEDFAAIIERHGLYYNNLERFAEVARNAPHQMTLTDQAREDAVDITEGVEQWRSIERNL